jgi:hypothetical protein
MDVLFFVISWSYSVILFVLIFAHSVVRVFCFLSKNGVFCFPCFGAVFICFKLKD